jgi:hypothetical protein
MRDGGEEKQIKTMELKIPILLYKVLITVMNA